MRHSKLEDEILGEEKMQKAERSLIVISLSPHGRHDGSKHDFRFRSPASIFGKVLGGG